jgi:hypothetical protein
MPPRPKKPSIPSTAAAPALARIGRGGGGAPPEADAGDGADSDDATSSDDTASSGGSASSSASSSSGGGSESDINVEFSFSDPRPIDFKSVRRLLERLLPGEEASFPVSSLAEDVVAQRVVGTMVKVPEDGYDDAYAFATLLPLGRFVQRDWYRALRAYTLKRAAGRGGDVARAALAAAWEAPAALGLLLNERILNMPDEIAPPLHDALLQDVAWAKESAPRDARADFHGVKQVLVVAPMWLEQCAEGGGGGGGGGGGAAAGAPAPACEAPGVTPPGWAAHYYRFEEELWAREATFSMSFPVASRATDAALASGSAGGGGEGAGAGAEAGAAEGAPPPRGRKRKAGQGAGAVEAEATALRAPELRRIMLVPVEALTAAAATMAQRLREGDAGGGGGGAAKRVKA